METDSLQTTPSFGSLADQLGQLNINLLSIQVNKLLYKNINKILTMNHH